MTKFLKKNKGFTLIETIFYIAVFALFSILIVNGLIVLSRSFRETVVYGDVIKGAHIMERISREIKQSDSISAISTTSLQLNSLDEIDAEVDTLQFSLSGTDVAMSENSVLVGNLNSNTILVHDLSFTEITTTEGEAVKVFLEISSTRDPSAKTYQFYDTLILRGSY